MGGIERGERNLTVQTVLTVARGLGMTMSELFSGIEEQAESPKQSTEAQNGTVRRLPRDRCLDQTELPKHFFDQFPIPPARSAVPDSHTNQGPARKAGFLGQHGQRRCLQER